MKLNQQMKLINLTKSGNIFLGFISARGQEYPFQIKLASSNSLKDASVKCSWKLRQIFGDSLELIHQRLCSSTSVNSFVIELQDILDKKISSNRNIQMLTSTPEYYAIIFEQLNMLGWKRITDTNIELSEVKVNAVDMNDRSHIMHLTFTDKFPDVAPLMKHEIPLPFEICWKKGSTLCDLYDQFCKVLEHYQIFWNYLDEIDAETWVLEPENPKRNDCFRRIFLGNNASILITLNPKYPSSIPECHFLGSEKIIGPIKRRLNKNIDTWDLTISVLENLSKILNIDFPTKCQLDIEDMMIECGICYSYRRDVMIPDKTCDNLNCNKSFHSTCLYEWLHSIPNPRQSFNTLFGECLYCGTVSLISLHSLFLTNEKKIEL
ncbi:E3 ubiquitin-protein ligase FANCL [Nymphon striatum]|nr:E3 ubiquitin-protein ligase FANCL [Nymphon striatum]